MKVSCNVIRDILPLYVENMTSADTRKMVKEHVDSCENCRKQLEEMSIPHKLPVDTDTAPLRKLKATLRKNKIHTVIFAVMLTLAAAIVAIAFLTAPRYLFSVNTVTIKENADGAVLAIFSDEVSGYHIHHYLADKGPGHVYHITTWNSIWSRYIRKNPVNNTVLNPDGQTVASVYYYMPYRSGDNLTAGNGDILIYGLDQNPDGGVQTLPRGFLAYYVFMAVALAVLGIIAMYLWRRHEARNVILKILFLPVAYLLGHLCIKGFYLPSYSATRDFYAILLVTIPLYIVLLSATYLIKDFKRA